MSDQRTETARAAAGALREHAPRLRRARVLSGFDGFVDRIIDVVARRHDTERYDRMASMEALADRIRAAAGRSANLELVVKREQVGGNGANLALAAGRLGAASTFLGAVGSPEDPDTVDSLFGPLAEACERVMPTGPPGETDALEFDDGKLMLGKPAPIARLDWPALLRAAGGPDGVRRRVGESSALAMGNWTMTAHMGEIWERLIEDALPAAGGKCAVFVDLADPAKRPDEDLAGALDQLERMNGVAPVTLGLNASEALQCARLRGVEIPIERAGRPGEDALRGAAETLRDAIGLTGVLTHSQRCCAASVEGEGSASFTGPFVRNPEISTGAGDHLNAGWCVFGALGLPVAQRLAAASALSGWYVSRARSPSLEDVIGFLEDLPAPEGA